MLSYRLGLDVGTNSLGWSVLELNRAGEPCAIVEAGSRIFSDGRRDSKSKSTLAADRRDARSARRRRDRYKQRQAFLLDELTKAGLFPESHEERRILQIYDPLMLRNKALKEKLEPNEIGRALFHLNQRRGFKSNRKDRSKETTGGMVDNSVTALLRAMGLMEEGSNAETFKELSKGKKKAVLKKEQQQKKEAIEKLRQQNALTFGSFLWQRRNKGEPTRARSNSDSKLYDVYPTREMLEHEFETIWKAQAEWHPELLTEQRRERIRTVIFTQRPLKPQEIGKCTYLSDEYRTFRAMPSFQRYRIYQEVNNLEWPNGHGKDRLIDHRDARDAIVNLLERPTNQKGNVPFGRMKKVLKRYNLIQGDIRFNFETLNREGFAGNLTSHVMRDPDRVGAQWDDWSLEKQDEFIGSIFEKMPDEKVPGKMREQTDDEVKCRLMKQYALPEYAAENCVNAPLEDGTASLSLRATRLLLKKMDADLMIQSDAVQQVAEEEAGFVNPFTRARDGKLLERLPYYGKAVQGHIIPGNGDEKDEQSRIGMVSNPTVHIALNQIRHVVNELIARHGRPISIAIELGRELPLGKEGRTEITREQKANQDNNKRLNNILDEQKQALTRDNRLRLQLWEELDEDPNGRRCPFSGQKICIADLFNGQAEIEHLIPFSQSLDDSRANKVICSRQANRDKDNQTPFQAFGHNQDGYNWDEIFERCTRLPQSKRWRFQEDALEIWYRDHADFTERHLNDTRYIGRLAKEYLENICPFNKIDVLTGRLTALLRGHWGLNTVLHDDNQQTEKKNRNDHRHHAVDAIVIGMTSRSMLQKVSAAANRAEKLHLERLLEKGTNGKSPIDPWDGFRDDVKTIVNRMIVSHKPKRKNLDKHTTDGQLHNDTAYGIIAGPDNRGCYEVVVRQPIEDFKNIKDVKSIRDKHLRHEFLQALTDAETQGGKGVEGVIRLAADKKVRRLRCTKKLNVIPIKDKSGKEYKAYKGDSNWGIEIYEYPTGHTKAGKWHGVVISRYEANQKKFLPGQTRKRHPAARLVIRLQINDCLEITENGNKNFIRLQKLTQEGRLYFAPLHETNVDARNRNTNDSFQYLEYWAPGLQRHHARKLHISPAGRVNYEKRRRPRRKK